MPQILIVEDDPLLAENLTSLLSDELYSVIAAQNIAEARSLNQAPDLILLDWRLPDGRGIDYLKELRTSDKSTPVMMLTSKSDIEDKVLGLELGANDYVTKPFAPKELLARVAVQLRSSKPSFENTNSPLNFKELSLCISSRTVSFQQKDVVLTKLEFDLLKLLLQNPEKVFSRDELLNTVWGFDSFPTTRTVDMHIKQLRQKTCNTYFKTVHGIGYSMNFENS